MTDIEITKWDMRFMRIAKHEVATWSKDPEEGVGCVIVSPDRRQMTTGYNGLPQGLADTPGRLHDKTTKNFLTVHAELNAILNARTNLTGWKLYATKPPCTECAKAIMQAGIVQVICPMIVETSRWFDDQILARNLLQEAEIRYIELMGVHQSEA